MAKKKWGFDTRDTDTDIRPQDDFFTYANGGWFKRASIPADESRWGTFQILRKETEMQLKALVQNLLKNRAPHGSEAQQIRDLYRSGVDMKTRNKLDLEPLLPFLKKIELIKTKEDLLTCVTELHGYGIGVLWSAAVEADEKNSTLNIFHVGQGGLGLPERDYYLANKPEQIRVRAAYRTHLEQLFSMMGSPPEIASRQATNVITIETKLAQTSMKKEHLRDPDKTYHKFTFSALKKLTKNISWALYLEGLGATPPPYVNVGQPLFLKKVDVLITKVPIAEWQSYLTFHLLSEAAPHLSDRFVKANFDFYGTALTGVAQMKPVWRRALGTVNGTLGEALGKLYVAKHFPPAAKRKMDELVSDLFAVYQERIKSLDWMSPATKKRALTKLAMMNRKIGYPSKWKSYKGLDINPEDHFGNILRSATYETRRELRKLGKKVDRTEWHMTPQTVNAYYNPTTNDIAFPAAILQPPYFGPKQDDALNYGAIGSVIGHEITHGFDDEGSKFDGHGNLHMWWTKEDRTRFMKKAQVLEKQFNAYSLHGVAVNGKLTLGENIADLGGYAISLDAYHRHLRKIGYKNINGLTPIQRFFFGMALDWRQVARPEVEKMFLLVDPHAPPRFGTNGPASNLPEFYEAWGLKKGDRLYRDPKNRAQIW